MGGRGVGGLFYEEQNAFNVQSVYESEITKKKIKKIKSRTAAAT